MCIFQFRFSKTHLYCSSFYNYIEYEVFFYCLENEDHFVYMYDSIYMHEVTRIGQQIFYGHKQI